MQTLPPVFEQIQDAADAIRAKWQGKPVAGIILGTGLGKLTEDIQAEAVIPYEQIPHFPRSTAPSHKGQLVCGTLGGKPVVAMEGRFHFYEGNDMARCVLPVRVMKLLGVEVLVVTNAAGGLNPQHRAGDIVVIQDHFALVRAS